VVAVRAWSGSVSSTLATSAASATVAGAAPIPVNSVPPTISGTAQVGNVLSASTGSWSGSPTSYAYQWKRCDSAGNSCVPISGATGATYKVTSSDDGVRLVVATRAHNSAGTSALATSDPTAIVAALAPAPSPVAAVLPANTSLPTIAGKNHTRFTQTAGVGTWSGSPTSYAYQWQRCDSAGNSCVPIPGATASTYTAASEDQGMALVVTIRATNSIGSSEATSLPSVIR
jgi:hypothetical protein